MGAYSRILLPWDSQPQEPVSVDGGNALSPKSGLWVPDRNIVTDRGITSGGSGSEPTIVATQSGRGIYSAGKYVQTDLPSAAFSVLTWVALIKPDAAPSGAGTFSSFFQTGQTTLNWNHTVSGYQGAFTLYDNGNYPTAKFTSGFSAGVEVLIGGTYDGATIKVFREGVLENSTSALNRTSGSPFNALQFVGGTGGTAAFGGSCSYFYWDTTRALTDAQMAQLMNRAAIWSVIAPRSIWVPVSAGGVLPPTLYPWIYYAMMR